MRLTVALTVRASVDEWSVATRYPSPPPGTLTTYNRPAAMPLSNARANPATSTTCQQPTDRPPAMIVTIYNSKAVFTSYLISSELNKGKVLLYSLPSVGPGADPGV